MKTLLLTGGTGYIGSHNAVLFLEKGYEIIIIDNFSNSSKDVLKNIEQITGKTPKFYKGDLRNIEDIESIFSENSIDAVIHFAGLKAVGESCKMPQEYYENNILGTMNLTKVMKKYNCINIVFSSTATVCSHNAPIPYTETTDTGNTTNPYATSKFIIENILRDLAQHTELNVCNLRYFNPIGAHSSGLLGENPNDIPNNLLPFVMKVGIGELQQISIFGDDYDTVDGTGVRDYIHIDDLSDAHMAGLEWILKQNGNGIFETFHLGTGQGTSVLEIIAYSERVMGKSLSKQIVPRRSGDIGEFYCSPKKAEKILGWKAQKTVKEAVADSWNFILKQNS